MKTIILLFNFSILLFFFLFVSPNKISAAVFYATAPPTGPAYSIVPTAQATSLCGTPLECANSHNINNCGLATCTGGNDWTKYELTCVQYLDPITGLTYDSYYQQSGIVYSIGDKCVSGEQGLRSSSCTNQMSDSMYKTCCSYGTPSLVNPGSCVQFEGDNTTPPWEGMCPAGYQREVFCGPGTSVICGQPACGPGIPADCTTNPSCTGTCTLTSSNTCSAGNGTKSGCKYYGDGTCKPVTAPDQTCNAGDHCSAGYTCDSYGTCVPDSCSAMTCRYTETVATSTCASGKQWVKGTGCSGDNCSGCSYVNSTCSTTQCYVPGATPTATPTASPTSPPAWGACGSCNTCMGPNKAQCVLDPEGVCQWDPTHCTPPPGDAYCAQPAIEQQMWHNSGCGPEVPFMGKVPAIVFDNSYKRDENQCGSLAPYSQTECWRAGLPPSDSNFVDAFKDCHNDLDCELTLNNMLSYCGCPIINGFCTVAPMSTCTRAMIRGVITNDTSSSPCGGSYFTKIATNGSQRQQLQSALTNALGVYDASKGTYLGGCSVYTANEQTRYGCYLDSTKIPASGLSVQIKLGSVTDFNGQTWAATCPTTGIRNPTVYPNSYGDGAGPYLFGDIAVLNQNFGLTIKPISAWIQVIGGDVHSNGRINAPGGP